MDVKLDIEFEPVLIDLAKQLDFTFVKSQVNYYLYSYQISDNSYITKQFADNFVTTGAVGTAYQRARVLYSLYACRRLEVSDIKYPTYYHWRVKHPEMSIDHRFPLRWFPELVFDCNHWQAMTLEENQQKSDDFAHEASLLFDENRQFFASVKNLFSLRYK